VRLVAAMLAGAGQAVALADGAGHAQGWLQALCMAVLCSLLVKEMKVSDASKAPWAAFKSGALLGWCFAWAWLSATFWWLYIAMHDFGGMPSWLAVFAVAALAGALAIYYAIACGLWMRWMQGSQGRQWHWKGALSFSALWTLSELMRGQWFTGFPWGAVGYAHVDGWLSGYAPWVGVYGIGALVAGLVMAISIGISGHSGKPLYYATFQSMAAGCLLLILPWAWTHIHGGWTYSAGHAQVRLLQGNIAQDEKFIPGRGVEDALTWYAQRLQDNVAPLVVAPETAIPLLPSRLPQGYWQTLEERYQQAPQQLALVGVPLGSEQQGYSNAVVSLGPKDMATYRYDKHHLVPFGEFIPPLFQWFLRFMNIPLGNFDRGALHQRTLNWQGQRLAPNICYEDLFGEELAAQLVPPPDKLLDGLDVTPTVLVNVSNIGWFGDTVAIDQHLNISRMRALELQRPMLRATNTGATAIIDHHGRVQAQLPRYTRGELNGMFEGRSGLTPFAWWAGRWGLMPLWVVCLLVCLWTTRGRAPRHT
jgi:apolipoprotein N-acyltransferase